MAGSRDTRVVFVKKLLAGGQPCAKCRDIENRLYKDELMACVDEIITAHEDDPASAGMELAGRHGVQRAPFFVLREADGTEHVMASYLALKRWLSRDAASDDLADTVDGYPDLAFL